MTETQKLERGAENKRPDYELGLCLITKTLAVHYIDIYVYIRFTLKIHLKRCRRQSGNKNGRILNIMEIG